MSIEPECDRCGRELDEPGGLVLSPPFWGTKVKKEHVGRCCWGDLYAFMHQGRPDPDMPADSGPSGTAIAQAIEEKWKAEGTDFTASQLWEAVEAVKGLTIKENP